MFRHREDVIVKCHCVMSSEIRYVMMSLSSEIHRSFREFKLTRISVGNDILKMSKRILFIAIFCIENYRVIIIMTCGSDKYACI